MAGHAVHSLVERAAERSAGALEACDDEELLRRFLERDDATAQDAFAALTRRHGPMVLGVCRHVLGRHQDAEDAFQATFLILARKAGSIRARKVLGRWLYEVAYRTAIRARRSAARRQAYERQGAQMTVVASDDRGRTWEDVGPVIHEELRRLPQKYRTPLVLCYLEGKTNEEAAKLLEWPVGTVKGRLSRARDMLRSRLNRRGVSLTIALLMLGLANNEGAADTLSDELVADTSRLALSVRGGAWSTSAAIPPAIAALLQQSFRLGLTSRGLAATALAIVILVAVTHALGSVTGGTPLGSWTAGVPQWSPATASAGTCHAGGP